MLLNEFHQLKSLADRHVLASSRLCLESGCYDRQQHIQADGAQGCNQIRNPEAHEVEFAHEALGRGRSVVAHVFHLPFVCGRRCALNAIIIDVATYKMQLQFY